MQGVLYCYKACFKTFCNEIGKGLIALDTGIREQLALFLCIQEKEDIKPKLKAGGIESSIFSLQLVQLNSSKICTPSIPGISGVIYFPLRNSFKPTYFLSLQTQKVRAQDFTNKSVN